MGSDQRTSRPGSRGSRRRLGHVRSLAVLVAALVVGSVGVEPAADTFVVTTTQDSGAGSFRWAIEEADTHVGPDTVLFAIPALDPGYDPELGVWTIKADTSQTWWDYNLRFDDSTFVDGGSQARFVGRDPNPYGPEIELQGPNITPPLRCFDIQSDGNEIRGLCINGFLGGAFEIDGWPPTGYLSRGNVVAGCYINVDPTGSSRKGGGGIGVGARYVAQLRIGGDEPEDRNIICAGSGDELQFTRSGGVEIVGNYISTDRTGTVDLGTTLNAFVIGHMTGPCVVRDNLILGRSHMDLVDISHSESDSAIVTFVGNRVGVGLDGSPQGARHDNIEVGHSPGHLFRDNIIANTLIFHGMYLYGGETDYVTISRNSIYGCGGLGIEHMTTSGVDPVDGVYGPGVNEEIDPPLCDSVVTSLGTPGQGATTSVYLTCMPECVVEVFVADPGAAYPCLEPGYGDVRSGMTYLGDAAETVPGPVWSSYELSVSPALAAGTFVTATATNQNGSTSEFGCTCRVPGMGASEPGCGSRRYRLEAPSPNPCSHSTTVRYRIPEAGRVQIVAYDTGGNLVATIMDEDRPAGTHAVEWTPETTNGRPLPGGLYLLRLEAEDFVTSRRLAIAR